MLDRVFLNGGSGIGAPYWLGSISGGFDLTSVALDPSANVSAFGLQNTQGAGSYDWETLKFDNAGANSWQNSLGDAGAQSYQSNRSRLMAVDGSSNTYITGNPSNTGLIAKYNAAGSLQWQKTLGSYTSYQLHTMTVDLSGNVYVAFTYYTGIRLVGVLCKLDTNGSLLWGTQYEDSGASIIFKSIAVNSSASTILLTGRVETGGSGTPLILKFNSSGTLTWSYSFSVDQTQFDITDCCFDPSNNFYVFGTSGGSYNATTIKFYYFNYLEWAKTYTPPSGFMTGRSIAADPTGGVVVCGEGTFGYFWKYNSSGIAQWQRQITHAGSLFRPRSLSCDVSGNFYFAGWASTSPTNLGFVGKLPGNGTLTGTYGSWDYTSIAGSHSDNTITTTERIYSTTSISPSVINAGYTNYSTTLPWTRTTL